MASLTAMMVLILSTLPQILLNGWAVALLAMAVLLVYVQYRRVAVKETELFGVAKNGPWAQTEHSLIVGLLGGTMGSAVLSLAGVGLVEQPGTASALLLLWPVSLALGLINPRFFCFAYSGSLLALSHLAFGWPTMDVPSVLGLVAVLHLVEGLLIRFSGDTCATPMSVERAGEAVPGFMLQRFWPVPLILPLFTAGAGAPVDMPSWWPLLTPDATAAGALGTAGGLSTLSWQLAPVVVTMGYSDLAIGAPPARRARQSFLVLLGYSALLLVLAVAGSHVPALQWAAALFSALGHEAMAVWSGRAQLVALPYLVRPPRGVGVLDVLPDSPAAAGGLRSGTVILAVDDCEVHSRQQLHEALLASPAYVSVLYRNGRQLEQCRLPRPGEGLFGFGAILLPEQGERALAQVRTPAFFRWSGLERQKDRP